MSSQAAEWKDGPAKRSWPSMAGKDAAIELPDRAHDPVDDFGDLGAVAGPHGQRPRPCGVVEAGLGHLAAEADALRQSQILGRRLEVGQQIGLGREAGDPVVRLREREAVELVRDVDTAARVDVLQPGAAHVTVLLEHGDRHAGLTQPVGRRHSGGARSDNGAPEGTLALGEAPRWFPRVAPLQRQLLGQEALPMIGGGADQEAEDPPPLLRRQVVVRPSRGQVVRQRRGRVGTRRGLLVGPEAAPGHEQLFLVRLVSLPQQRQVARTVGHRAQERVHVRRSTGRP